MDDYLYYYESLQKRLERLEKQVVNLQNPSVESLNKLIQECDSESKRVENDLESCENAILMLEKGPEKTNAEKNYMVSKERLNKCRTEIEFKRNKSQSHALFGRQMDEEAKEPSKKLGEMSAQLVIEKGDNLYAEAESRLQNALGITEQSKQVVGGIEVELKQQEDQIDRIHDKTEDVRSNIKRANKVMSLIYRRYLTDKCIAMLIIMIIIVLIIVIIFGIINSGKISVSTDSIH